MIVYILMLLIAIIFTYLSMKSKAKKVKIVFAIFATLPFFIVSAIRYEVGTDFVFRYIGDFNKIANGMEVDNLEIGFKCIIKLCLLLSQNSQWLFVITSALIIFLIMFTIFKHSKNPFISVTIFLIGGFFFQSLNLVRQFLAMSMIVFSYHFLFEKKKMIYFLITIIMAFFIHSSSIIMLILLISKDKLILKPIIVIPIIVLISLCDTMIMDLISPIIDQTRYEVYLVGLYAKGETSLLYNITNLMLYFYMIVFYRIKLKNGQEMKEDKFWINIQGLAVIFTFMSSVHMLFSRIAYYFMIFQIISIPYFIETTKIKEIHLGEKWTKRVLYGIIIVFFMAITFYTNILNNDNEPLPYKTIFDKEREIK